MNPQQYPTLEQFAANVAAVIGKIEVIEQELYDRIIYPTAGLAVMSFFQVPKGAGFSSESQAAATAKTLADTNMTQNGQLPAPQAFWVDNIQVEVDPGSVSTANLYTTRPTMELTGAAAAIATNGGILDKNLILNSGLLTFSIGPKPYYNNGPLSTFPPRSQKRIDTALTMVGVGSGLTVNNNMWVAGDVRTLDPGLGIPTGMNFGVDITWQALQATPSGFNARVKCSLGGWLFRAAQ